MLVAPIAVGGAWAQEQKPRQKPPGTPPPPPAQAPAAPAPAGGPESKLKLSKEQEEKVKQAIERRERQWAAIRNHPLAYSDEPAFVFRAKAKSKS